MSLARALVADSLPGFREKLAGLLSACGVEVVGEVAEVEELTHALSTTIPDILILDMSLVEPIDDLVFDTRASFMQRLRSNWPGLVVVVLSTMGNGTDSSEFAEKIGGFAYMNKEDVLSELPKVMQKIVDGAVTR